MKIKRLFSILGLSLFGLVSVGAGVSLAPKKSAEPVKADGEWMFRIQFNLGVATSWEPSVENVRFHCWGTNLDQTFSMGRSGVNYNHNTFGVNVTLGSTQTVDGGQFIFDQGGETKWSVNLSSCTFSSTGSDFVRHYSYYNGDWTDGKFNTVFNGAAAAPKLEMTSVSNANFVANPSKNRWDLTNYSFAAVEGKDISARYWNVDLAGEDYSISNVQTTSQKYVPSGSDSAGSWATLSSYGTYDFFLTNETIGNGQLAIRQYSPKVSSYIYYVLEPSNLSTDDYIYAWDGSEQFESWPGKQVKSVTNVEKYFGDTVLKFEGSAKAIYKIPVEIGYPTGDQYFKFNNGVDGEGHWESSTGTLVAGAAYWYTAEANANAGAAIDFLIDAEDIRNSAGDYSVCNVSQENAAALVSRYNLLTSAERDFIDRSTAYTYADKAKTSNTDVSYRDIMERLAMIAKVEIVGGVSLASEVEFGSFSSNTTIIIISVVALCSVSFIALILIKKRKHQ